MSSTKLSSNYQIVVPKDVRKKLGLAKGQVLYLQSVGRNTFTFTTKSPVNAYFGVLKGAWTDPDQDAAEYTRQLRNKMQPQPKSKK